MGVNIVWVGPTRRSRHGVKGCVVLALAFAACAFPARAQSGLAHELGLDRTPAPTNAVSRPAALSTLSQDQMVLGLKQALSQGVQRTITELGHQDGFLTNLAVRIPMPQQLQRIEKTLRALGQDKLADEFITTLNHAAEQAVPKAAGVFGQAVGQMSIPDAVGILTGPQDAATRYFQRATETNLFTMFLPIVKQATEAAGATAAYKRLLQELNANPYVSGLARMLDVQTVDLDGYVTQSALNGLFKMIAAEEKRIRQDPVARATDLLQRVFGAVIGSPGRR